MIDISTRVLRAMIALDDLRHFSLAAERCFVTQSALSQMISKLENQVDVRLIDRDRRRVGLTPEGVRFVETARRVMLELEEISMDLKDHASLRKGRITMAALPSLSSHWLPPIIAQFRAKYPGIQVGLNDAPPDRALEQVRQRQADFALTARGPGMVGFQHRLLFEESFVLVCHRSHPLASRKRLGLGDLAGHDYIRLVRTGSIAQHLEKFFRDHPVNETGLEVEQVSTLAGLVASNLGISLVPAAAVPYFNARTVAAIPIGGADLARPIYLVWRSAGTLSPAAQSFVDMLTFPVAPKRPK
jgi:LysR family carnitine catabolism transcriptional activator